MDISLAIFFVISAVTLVACGIVAFSKNMIYSAFALLGVFAGVLGLYILLSADFVAIVQLVIYIGGILVLILFAVMLTTRIDMASGERRLVNKAMEPLAAFFGIAILGALIWKSFFSTHWTVSRVFYGPTTAAIGEKLLNEYLLPFEIISLLLILGLVGAMVLGRREVK